MSATFAALDRGYFEDLVKRSCARLGKDELLSIELVGESSQFVRVNGAKVRQAGIVDDASLNLTLFHKSGKELRRASRLIHLSGLAYTDQAEALDAVRALQAEVPTLPPDPYAAEPLGADRIAPSSQTNSGRLLEPANSIDELLGPLAGLDVAGIYASGPAVRAMANSAGLRHWFATDSFSFNYSIYTPGQRAVKETYAGALFDAAAFRRSLSEAQTKLRLLEIPARTIERGKYRVYLAPAALNDLVRMFSWGAISEASIRQGDSPLRKVRAGTESFSPKFTLAEDFSLGFVPRFNSEGELAPETLALIKAGKLENTLVSSRSAHEYQATGNGAEQHEGLRSPAVAAGTLPTDQVLARLGTGLYLSQLHYLNWSDQPGGRITGMTRYACFWVENGQIIAPIENMRWDDTLFSMLGTGLEDFTVERETMPEVGSYDHRHLGGALLPGALLSEMRFTL